MKILITTDVYNVNINGVVTSVMSLANGLMEHGHDVKILTLSDHMKSHQEGNVYYISSFSLNKIYPGIRGTVDLFCKFVDELITWKPDVIHSQCEFFTFEFARRISAKTGAPILHTYHTMYDHYTKYFGPFKPITDTLLPKIVRFRLRDTAAVIAPSQKTEDTLKDYELQPELRVIPTGISMEKHHWRIEEIDREKTREEFGIPKNAFVLVSLGRLGEEKRVDVLIRYFTDLAREDSTVYLMIVGDGPNRQSLVDLSKELHVEDRVIFTGMAKPSEVPKFYQLGDVFVCASLSETQGLTYVEAAANGLPLVCQEDTCLNGILMNGINGFTFTTSEEFRKFVRELQENPELRQNASVESVMLSDKFDTEHFVDSVEQLYDEVLKNKGKEEEK